MEGIGNGLKEAFLVLILFCLIIFAGGTWLYGYLSDNTIKSSKPIIPEIRLKVVENKIDTIYIYHEKDATDE